MSFTMAPDAQAPSRHGLLISLAFVSLTVSMVLTMTVPILAHLPMIFGVGVDDASWLFTAALLAGTISTPAMTRLADMYGKRRMALIVASAGVTGSLLVCVSWNLWSAVVGRALEGTLLAIIPLSISMARDLIPSARLPKAMAAIGATVAIGGALALPLSGILFANFGWRSEFIFNTLGGICVLLVLVLVIPSSPVKSGGHFDIVGAVLLSCGLGGLLIAISKGGTWGWGSSNTVTCLAVAVAALVLWVPWEQRVSDPLIDLRTTSHRSTLLTNAASVLIGAAMLGNMYTAFQVLELPQESGMGFGLGLIQASLVVLPAAFAMVIAASVAGRVITRSGPRLALVGGALLTAIGYLVHLMLHEEIWQVALGTMIVAAGTAIAYGAMPTLIIASVPASETAAANGLNTVARNLGATIFSAIIAAVSAAHLVTVDGASVPSSTVFRILFILSAAAATISAGIALGLPRDSPRKYSSSSTSPITVAASNEEKNDSGAHPTAPSHQT